MSNSSNPPRPALASVRCADITPAAVSWLWEPYLARGKLAVLDGDPGTGKSFVTIDLAARVTRGLPLPGSTTPGLPGTVLLLNAEDDARDTIRPRVAAAGGDPDRVRVLAAPGLGLERLPRFPDDAAALEGAVRESGAALVVIDPMMAFFPPEVSANSDQCVRAALTPLAGLAAATDACLLLVRHLRKSGGASAIYRGSGSIGIVGAVRTGLVVARHPDDSDLRVLTLCKTNIGPPGPSLGFRLGRRESGQTFVDWTGVVDMTADDLFSASLPLRAGQRPRERACEWLRRFLADGPRRAPEVIAAAQAAGIPHRTLDRVKATAGVASEARHVAGKTEWWWSDPAAERTRDRRAGLTRHDDLPPLGRVDELPEVFRPESLRGDAPTEASVNRLIRTMNRLTRDPYKDDEDDDDDE
jgi:hypothetical protein